MAQVTTQTVPNGSGASVRSNMNGIFGALFSSSSGASAPSTTVAGQLWLDTGATNPILRVRNSANTAWDSIRGAGRVQERSSAYTTVFDDIANLIRCTSTMTLTLGAPGTLGDGWIAEIVAESTGVTIDPDGANINGSSSTVSLGKGASATIYCDGTAFYMVKSEPDTFIQQTVVSSATSEVGFTLDTDTYKSFRLEMSGVYPTAAAIFNLRVSADGGSTVDNGASDYAWGIDGRGSGTGVGNVNSADTLIRLSQTVGNSSGNGVTGTVNILSPGSATLRTNAHCIAHYRNGSGQIGSTIATGQRETDAAHDYFEVFFTSTTIAGGTFNLYGVI